MSIPRWPLDAEPLTEADIEAMTEDLEECSNCQNHLFADEMRECANSIPGHGRGPFHCWDCVAGDCCGACSDEDRREWAAEHGRRA